MSLPLYQQFDSNNENSADSFSHTGNEKDNKEEENTTNYIKNSTLIDMDKITKMMSDRLICQSIVRGFVIYGNIQTSGENFVSNPGIFSTFSNNDKSKKSNFFSALEYDQKLNAITLGELEVEMGNINSLVPLSIEDINSCFSFFNNNPTVRLSSSVFKSQLFENPFDVNVISDNETILAELSPDIREVIIKNYWMPMLKSHYDWIKIIGICPFYFEPIGLKQNGRSIIHYVPVVPCINSGTIYTYLNNKNKQNYVWKWINSSTGPAFINNYENINGQEEEGEALYSNSTSGVFGSNNGGIEVGESFLFITKNGKKNSLFGLKKTRYMFFDVKNPPLIDGRLTSDIKTIIPDWIQLNIMIKQTVEAGDKMINPECVIEFSPDIAKATSGDDIDMMRLQIELLKERSKSPTAGLDDYSGLFGQQIATPIDDFFNGTFNGNFGNRTNPLQGESALSRINKARRNMIDNNQNIYSDADLGLNTYNQAQGDGSFGSIMGVNGTAAELEKYIVYAKNNPFSDVDIALRNTKKMSAMRERLPSNCKYLNPYERVSTSSPKPTMPNYNLKSIYDRLDKIISSICDFPLELFLSGTINASSISGGGSSGAFSSKMDLFKERLKTQSKTYETLINQMWAMAYIPFIKNTKRDLQRRTKYTEYDINLIYLFEKTKITFPRTPFLGANDYSYLYKLGFINVDQFYHYVADRYGIEEQTLTPSMKNEIEKKLQQALGMKLPEEKEKKEKKEKKEAQSAKKRKKAQEEEEEEEEEKEEEEEEKKRLKEISDKSLSKKRKRSALGKTFPKSENIADEIQIEPLKRKKKKKKTSLSSE
jgi:hypothetical protein